MSDRERWTVYPLLFLAIGLAMRAVLIPPPLVGDIDAIRLVCREILVKDEDGTVVLHLGRVAEGGGRLEINDGEGNSIMAIGSLPPIRPTDRPAEEKSDDGETAAIPAAGIEFSGPDGEAARRLTADAVVEQ